MTDTRGPPRFGSNADPGLLDAPTRRHQLRALTSVALAHPAALVAREPAPQMLDVGAPPIGGRMSVLTDCGGHRRRDVEPR